MAQSSNGDRRKTTITSLEVIDAVDELGNPSLSEISKYIGLSPSTTYTHVQTLVDCGYLIKEEKTYQLGLKLFHLGEEARRRDDRYERAKEQCAKLANETGEEVSFAVPENGRSIILYDEINNPSVEGFQVGHQFYMHNSASGKAMLAEFPQERIEEVIDQWGLPAQTENTITERAALFDELAQIRSQGYAVNRQEAIDGFRSVAIAIHNPDGSVFGSLDVSGPPYRLPSDSDLVERLRSAVTELERQLEPSSSNR